MDKGRINEISASGKVEYDLTRPRTAIELGMPADRTSGIIERPHGGNKYLHIAFTLPGGTVFTNDRAFGVGVAAPLTRAGDNSIVVNSREMSQSAVAAALLAAASLFHLDRTEIDLYLKEVDLEPPFGNTPVVFQGNQFGYLSTDVEVRPNENDAEINYTFSWETGRTPEPTPEGSS